MRHFFGYVYAVEYDDGNVKVGMSAYDPNGRIRTHDNMMRRKGAKKVGEFVSSRIAHPRIAEQSLIAEARELSTHDQRGLIEWFCGIGIEWVDKVVDDHVFTYCESETLEEKREYEQRMAKAMPVPIAPSYDEIMSMPIGGQLHNSVLRAVGGRSSLDGIVERIGSKMLTIRAGGAIFSVWPGGGEVFVTEGDFSKYQAEVEKQHKEISGGKSTIDWRSIEVHMRNRV